jgi:riboflavin-specific deaminase-like protein
VAIQIQQLDRHGTSRLAMTKIRPYVIVKVAQSSDGKIAAKKGVRTQITDRVAMNYVQKLRQSVDAILVGANTVRIDDPQLNVRDRRQKQPLRIVLTRSGKIDPKSRIFRTHGGMVVFVGCRDTACRAQRSRAQRAVPLRNIIKPIHRLNVRRLLVEGGTQIFSQFLKSNLVDEWHVITSKAVLGKGGADVFGGVNRQPLTVDRQLRKKGFVVKEKKMLGKDGLIIFGRRGTACRAHQSRAQHAVPLR